MEIVFVVARFNGFLSNLCGFPQKILNNLHLKTILMNERDKKLIKTPLSHTWRLLSNCFYRLHMSITIKVSKTRWLLGQLFCCSHWLSNTSLIVSLRSPLKMNLVWFFSNESLEWAFHHNAITWSVKRLVLSDQHSSFCSEMVSLCLKSFHFTINWHFTLLPSAVSSSSLYLLVQCHLSQTPFTIWHFCSYSVVAVSLLSCFSHAVQCSIKIAVSYVISSIRSDAWWNSMASGWLVGMQESLDCVAAARNSIATLN